MSRFTGSAGTAVVTRDAALLWTDGRYFLQAEAELGAAWTLMRSGEPGVPTIEEYLSSTTGSTPHSFGGAVGVDAAVVSAASAAKLRFVLAGAGRSLHAASWSSAAQPNSEAETLNPVDVVWGAARPPPPTGAVRVHPLEHAGRSVEQKLSDVRAALASESADAHIVAEVSVRDSVASDPPLPPPLPSPLPSREYLRSE